MEPKINIFDSTGDLIKAFADFFFRKARQRIDDKKTFTVALSGGTTPNTFYKYLAKNQQNAPEWKSTHLFWGDERMVPSENPASNFGLAKKLFIDNIDIPTENIHPIRGESDVDNEAARYSCEITSYVHEDGSLPSFDLIILGLGEDGHTASIFPNQIDLIYSGRVCETAIQPKTGQQRLTLSGKTINNARNVAFLVSGEKKATMVKEILNREGNYEKYPAALITPDNGNLYWFVDQAAATYIQTGK